MFAQTSNPVHPWANLFLGRDVNAVEQALNASFFPGDITYVTVHDSIDPTLILAAHNIRVGRGVRKQLAHMFKIAHDRQLDRYANLPNEE